MRSVEGRRGRRASLGLAATKAAASRQSDRWHSLHTRGRGRGASRALIALVGEVVDGRCSSRRRVKPRWGGGTSARSDPCHLPKMPRRWYPPSRAYRQRVLGGGQPKAPPGVITESPCRSGSASAPSWAAQVGEQSGTLEAESGTPCRDRRPMLGVAVVAPPSHSDSSPTRVVGDEDHAVGPAGSFRRLAFDAKSRTGTNEDVTFLRRLRSSAARARRSQAFAGASAEARRRRFRLVTSMAQ
jgi:hypothetical protein